MVGWRAGNPIVRGLGGLRITACHRPIRCVPERYRIPHGYVPMQGALCRSPATDSACPAQGYRTRQQQVPIAGAQDLLIMSRFDRLQYFDPDGAAERAGISAAA